MEAAVRALVGAAREARSLAITSQREATLAIDLSSRAYSVDARSQRLNVPNGASLVLTTATTEIQSDQSGKIRFFPDGSSTGGQIHLRYRAIHYLIDVNWITGRVSLLQ